MNDSRFARPSRTRSLTSRTGMLTLALFALAGCGGGQGLVGSSQTDPSLARPATAAPPVDMAGRWQLSSPGRGQCQMTFGGGAPGASEGTIAPAGGCPGNFFTSRKWTYDQAGLSLRDHNGEPLAQLSHAGGRFEGKATDGAPIVLMR